MSDTIHNVLMLVISIAGAGLTFHSIWVRKLNNLSVGKGRLLLAGWGFAAGISFGLLVT